MNGEQEEIKPLPEQHKASEAVYTMSLTHDETHIIAAAVFFAIAFLANEQELGMRYIKVFERSDESTIEQFVDKLVNVHSRFITNDELV